MNNKVKKLNKEWVLINGYWVAKINIEEIAAIKVVDNGSCVLFKVKQTRSLADSMLEADLHGHTSYIGYVSKEGFAAYLGSSKAGEDAFDIYEALKIGKQVGTYVSVDYNSAKANRACAMVSGMINGALTTVGYVCVEELEDCAYFYTVFGKYIVHDTLCIEALVKMAATVGIEVKVAMHSAIEAYEEN